MITVMLLRQHDDNVEVRQFENDDLLEIRKTFGTEDETLYHKDTALNLWYVSRCYNPTEWNTAWFDAVVPDKVKLVAMLGE